MVKLLKGKKKRYSKKNVLEKIVGGCPEKPFRRDWLEGLREIPRVEGLQYLKDIPSVRSDN